MLTNDLKKGMRVKLRNGWYATVMDNMKGNTRMCQVEGFHTEIGSVYAWDIVFYIPESSPAIALVHTEKQIKGRERAKAMGF